MDPQNDWVTIFVFFLFFSRTVVGFRARMQSNQKKHFVFFVVVAAVSTIPKKTQAHTKRKNSLTMKINPFVVGGGVGERTHFGNAMIFDTFSWLAEILVSFSLIFRCFGDND